MRILACWLLGLSTLIAEAHIIANFWYTHGWRWGLFIPYLPQERKNMSDQTVTTSEVDWELLVRINMTDAEEEDNRKPVVYEFPNGRKFKRPEDPYNG